MDARLLEVCLAESRRLMEPDKLYHDFAHAVSVLKNAQWLVGVVGGDDTVIYAACLFHDIARDGNDHGTVGAEMVRKLLSEMPGFPNDKVDETALAVKRHESDHVTHNEKVVSDADKLDAFTELGLARSLMMAGKRGLTLRKAIDSYADLLRRWSDCFYFEPSRERAAARRVEMTQVLKAMLAPYSI